MICGISDGSFSTFLTDHFYVIFYLSTISALGLVLSVTGILLLLGAIRNGVLRLRAAYKRRVLRNRRPIVHKTWWTSSTLGNYRATCTCGWCSHSLGQWWEIDYARSAHLEEVNKW